MTERQLIPCPICHGSTKEIQGVLCCIANCRTQFYGLANDKWYVATNDEVMVLEAKIKSLEGQIANVSEFVGRGYNAAIDGLEAQVASLKTRLEQVSNLHLFSVVKSDSKMLSQDITVEMSEAYYAAGETPDEAWRAMWKAADEDLYVNPVSNRLLKRSIEIAWERGFKGAHNGAPNARSMDIGTVIHVAFEELVREQPHLFKELTPEQFSE